MRGQYNLVKGDYENMKNKTIYIGPSGSGKSYKALEKVVKNKGTTIILNYSKSKNAYEDSFLELKNFEERDGRDAFEIKLNGKYFITNQVIAEQSAHATEFVRSLIQLLDFIDLKTVKKIRVLFDDGSWNRIPDKVLMLWQLSHIECGISITVNSSEELLDSDVGIDDKMLKDLKKYWNIVYCFQPGREKRL